MFKRSIYHLIRTWKETFTKVVYFLKQQNVLLLICAVFIQRSWELGFWENTTNFTIVLLTFRSILDKSIIAELLWENMLVCAPLEDQYVKSEVYERNCKSAYQLNLQKKHFCYVNESGETNYCYCILLMMETTW